MGREDHRCRVWDETSEVGGAVISLLSFADVVRYDQLHRAAISFPADRFTYIGIDDEGDTTEHYAGEVRDPSACDFNGTDR